MSYVQRQGLQMSVTISQMRGSMEWFTFEVAHTCKEAVVRGTPVTILHLDTTSASSPPPPNPATHHSQNVP